MLLKFAMVSAVAGELSLCFLPAFFSLYAFLIRDGRKLLHSNVQSIYGTYNVTPCRISSAHPPSRVMGLEAEIPRSINLISQCGTVQFCTDLIRPSYNPSIRKSQFAKTGPVPGLPVFDYIYYSCLLFAKLELPPLHTSNCSNISKPVVSVSPEKKTQPKKNSN